MREKRIWKVRASDLRRMAAVTVEPERQRKMLVLAEELEEREAASESRPEAQDEPPHR
jgi:hypothetical protein